MIVHTHVVFSLLYVCFKCLYGMKMWILLHILVNWLLNIKNLQQKTFYVLMKNRFWENEFHLTSLRKYKNVLKIIIAVILHHHVTSASSFFVLRQFQSISSSCFLTLKACLWNSTSATHKSTPTQPPSLLRALESNFLLINFTIKAPLMPTSATLPFCFFSSISFYMILISSWALWNTVCWHNENSFWAYCSFRTDTNIGALLSHLKKISASTSD